MNNYRQTSYKILCWEMYNNIVSASFYYTTDKTYEY